MADEELLTAKKIAEKFGLSAKKVTDYIKQNDLEPDKKRGACKYFGPEKQTEIEKALK